MDGAGARPASPPPCTSCVPCSCLGDFLDQASIPCLAYMRRGQHGAQRLFWFLIFCLAFGAFLYFFSMTMNNYNESPVILGRDKHARHVGDLHFPAVTICPESKINLTLFNYTDTFIRYQRKENLSEEEKEILNDLSYQCEQGFKSENPNINTIYRIEKFSLDPYETIAVVYFLDDTAPPTDFKPVLTDVGMCFSFNMLPGNMLFANDTFHSSRSYLDYDYSNETLWDPDLDFNLDHSSTYPFKAFGAGVKRGLHFYVFVETHNLDFLCSGAVEGFKASLRSSFAPDDRLCFFPGERALRFFKHYTLANCELECLANATLRACGCVEFYMPRSPETPICGQKNLTCSRRVATLLHAAQLGIETEVEDHCNCLQSCSYVKYKSKMSLSSLLTERYFELLADKKAHTAIRATVISIYFEEATYTPMRRYEMYSLPDFIVLVLV
ncbi:Pickpocket protein 28 [Gryllus bimaculatus]|nr:Pickpocket protein 28 [Gryllus bimaculatus]